jgi:hypothetical protein
MPEPLCHRDRLSRCARRVLRQLTRPLTRPLTLTLPLSLLLGSVAAQAHEGHGLPGVSHWHALDAGSVAVVAIFFVGLWLLGKK